MCWEDIFFSINDLKFISLNLSWIRSLASFADIS